MDKKNLLILGAGQYGRVVKETAEAMGCFGKISFLDDNSPLALGKLDEYSRFAGKYACGCNFCCIIMFQYIRYLFIVVCFGCCLHAKGRSHCSHCLFIVIYAVILSINTLNRG